MSSNTCGYFSKLLGSFFPFAKFLKSVQFGASLKYSVVGSNSNFRRRHFFTIFYIKIYNFTFTSKILQFYSFHLNEFFTPFSITQFKSLSVLLLLNFNMSFSQSGPYSYFAPYGNNVFTSTSEADHNSQFLSADQLGNLSQKESFYLQK